MDDDPEFYAGYIKLLNASKYPGIDLAQTELGGGVVQVHLKGALTSIGSEESFPEHMLYFRRVFSRPSRNYGPVEVSGDDDPDDFVYISEWSTNLDPNIYHRDFTIETHTGYARIVYANNKIQVLNTPFYLDENFRLTCSPTFTEAGDRRVQIYVWLNVTRLIDKYINEGKVVMHRQLLCTQFARFLQTTTTPDTLRVFRENNMERLRFVDFEEILRNPKPVSFIDVDTSLFTTDLWGVQRYFISRAMHLDDEGIVMRWYDPMYTRVANRKGHAFFVDSSRSRILHADEVGPPRETTIRGGFLIESVGLGKTLSMLSLCVLYPAPEHHHMDVHGKPLRMPDGRVVSRATLVVCPAQVCVHWEQQIKDHLSRTYKIICITTKREHARYTFKDVMEADFIIISFNFINNTRFRKCVEDYGPIGWTNFKSRLDNSLHESKRRKGEHFVEETEMSLAHVYFWRLVVDEFHEMDMYTNRAVESAVHAIAARSRWGMSASILASDTACVNGLAFLMAPHEVVDPEYKAVAFSGIVENYDCTRTFMEQCFVKSDPTAITDMHLPGIVEHVHWLDFSQAERNIYQSLHHSPGAQLRTCCMPRLTHIEIPEIEACASLDEAKKVIEKHMHEKLTRANNSVAHWQSIVNHTEQQIQENGDNRALRTSLTSAKKQLENSQKLASEAERSKRFIQASDAAGARECSICYDDMVDPHILECGHLFCAECCQRLFQLNAEMRRCPTCRDPITSKKSVLRVRDKDESSEPGTSMDALNTTHGTKVASIIRFIIKAVAEDPTEKFVIFSRFDQLLHEIGRLLKTHLNVLFVKGSKDSKMKAINTFAQNVSHPVLMLSAQYSGSGVCLTMARNVIILDVPTGTASMIAESEKQVVGRVFRPPQAREVRVHRFLIRNTLEQEIYDSTISKIDMKSVWNLSLMST